MSPVSLQPSTTTMSSRHVPLSAVLLAATPTLSVLYRNPGEGTCVLDLRTAAIQGR